MNCYSPYYSAIPTQLTYDPYDFCYRRYTPNMYRSNLFSGGKVIMLPNKITGKKEYFYQKLDPVKGPVMYQIYNYQN